MCEVPQWSSAFCLTRLAVCRLPQSCLVCLGQPASCLGPALGSETLLPFPDFRRGLFELPPSSACTPPLSSVRFLPSLLLCLLQSTRNEEETSVPSRVLRSACFPVLGLLSVYFFFSAASLAVISGIHLVGNRRSLFFLAVSAMTALAEVGGDTRRRRRRRTHGPL